MNEDVHFIIFPLCPFLSTKRFLNLKIKQRVLQSGGAYKANITTYLKLRKNTKYLQNDMFKIIKNDK